ncbi:unnamed protein product [Amoebophrya sp. A120]|nr:unnamed protein product [Amoebophrya sp. A120]|eukprot:GSA120T00007642001.1
MTTSDKCCKMGHFAKRRKRIRLFLEFFWCRKRKTIRLYLLAAGILFFLIFPPLQHHKHPRQRTCFVQGLDPAKTASAADPDKSVVAGDDHDGRSVQENLADLRPSRSQASTRQEAKKIKEEVVPPDASTTATRGLKSSQRSSRSLQEKIQMANATIQLDATAEVVASPRAPVDKNAGSTSSHDPSFSAFLVRREKKEDGVLSTSTHDLHKKQNQPAGFVQQRPHELLRARTKTAFRMKPDGGVTSSPSSSSGSSAPAQNGTNTMTTLQILNSPTTSSNETDATIIPGSENDTTSVQSPGGAIANGTLDSAQAKAAGEKSAASASANNTTLLIGVGGVVFGILIGICSNRGTAAKAVEKDPEKTPESPVINKSMRNLSFVEGGIFSSNANASLVQPAGANESSSGSEDQRSPRGPQERRSVRSSPVGEQRGGPPAGPSADSPRGPGSAGAAPSRRNSTTSATSSSPHTTRIRPPRGGGSAGVEGERQAPNPVVSTTGGPSSPRSPNAAINSATTAIPDPAKSKADVGGRRGAGAAMLGGGTVGMGTMMGGPLGGAAGAGKIMTGTITGGGMFFGGKSPSSAKSKSPGGFPGAAATGGVLSPPNKNTTSNAAGGKATATRKSGSSDEKKVAAQGNDGEFLIGEDDGYDYEYGDEDDDLIGGVDDEEDEFLGGGSTNMPVVAPRTTPGGIGGFGAAASKTGAAFVASPSAASKNFGTGSAFMGGKSGMFGGLQGRTKPPGPVSPSAPSNFVGKKPPGAAFGGGGDLIPGSIIPGSVVPGTVGGPKGGRFSTAKAGPAPPKALATGVGLQGINLKARPKKRILKRPGDPPSPKKRISWRDGAQSMRIVPDRVQDGMQLLGVEAQVAAVEERKNNEAGGGMIDGEYDE